MSATILFGLLSASMFGASDILARFTGRSIGVVRSILYGHSTAAVTLNLFVPVLRTTESHGVGVDRSDVREPAVLRRNRESLSGADGGATERGGASGRYIRRRLRPTALAGGRALLGSRLERSRDRTT